MFIDHHLVRLLKPQKVKSVDDLPYQNSNADATARVFCGLMLVSTTYWVCPV
jgi:hypothetical protein